MEMKILSKDCTRRYRFDLPSVSPTAPFFPAKLVKSGISLIISSQRERAFYRLIRQINISLVIFIIAV
jgi:hypothetical protein